MINCDRMPFEEIFHKLWKINRSVCGAGLNESLDIIAEYVDLKILEAKSGESVYDWVVPSAWEVSHARLFDSKNNLVLDYDDCNLHLISHSASYCGWLPFEELKAHLYYDEDRPTAIPYRTSYYSENWGFCLSKSQFSKLNDDSYYVDIKTNFDNNGALRIGEYLHVGKSDRCLVFTTYPCHPSMANNELSGVLALMALASKLKSLTRQLNHSVRVVFAPETIGDLVYINKTSDILTKHMIGGAVVSMVGNNAPLCVEPAQRRLNLFEKCLAAQITLEQFPIELRPASPKKRMAQRQYCSPGFKLPLSALSRAFGGAYNEYHSSLDTIDVISFERIAQVSQYLYNSILMFDTDCRPLNIKPYGEPFLSKYKLGVEVAGCKITDRDRLIRIVLQNSDGINRISDISEMADAPYEDILSIVNLLAEHSLLELEND